MTKLPKDTKECDLCNGKGYLYQYRIAAEKKAAEVIRKIIKKK